MIAAAIATGCSRAGGAGSAKDFIKQYSQAFEQEDCGSILKLRAGREAVEKMTLRPEIREAIRAYDWKREDDRVREEVKAHGPLYQAWRNTSYVSEQTHGDHIHVEVTVNGTPSTVVLVKHGTLLKIHPRPSWVD